MSNIEFPNSPSVNDTYTAVNGIIYKWDGTKWVNVPKNLETLGHLFERVQLMLMFGSQVFMAEFKLNHNENNINRYIRKKKNLKEIKKKEKKLCEKLMEITAQ